MGGKAFLHKKSLIDKFRDGHKKGTGYIQAARARRTWNNPITRNKRTKQINGWINSFAGKRHIRKLSRFNALKESNMEITNDMLEAVLAYYKENYHWSDELVDNEREGIREWLQGYSDVFVPAYSEGGVEKGLQAIWDAEEMGVTRAELAMQESRVDYAYTKKLMDTEFFEEAQELKDFLEYVPHPWIEFSIVDNDYTFCVIASSNNKRALEKFENSDDYKDVCDSFQIGVEDYEILDHSKEYEPVLVESKETIEKLDYEKGHKNSRGEKAPWVIRSHKDNRVLASFPTKAEAEEHLKRMQQYSKEESHQEALAPNQFDYYKTSFICDGSLVEKTHSGYVDAQNDLYAAKNRGCNNLVLIGIKDGKETHLAIKGVTEKHSHESKDLAGFTDDVVAELVVFFHYGEDGAEKLASKHSDVIEQEYIDGELIPYGVARELAIMDSNKYASESCKNESVISKKFKGKTVKESLKQIDTTRVPQWLWVAYETGDKSGLEDEEIEELQSFEYEYKDNYLADDGEEPTFCSWNDVDSLGGVCYTVNVYDRMP